MSDRPTPRLAELSRGVAAAVNDLVEVARAAQRAELGESLVDAAKRWPEPHATVVVVGEAGAGRSTVVNVLVGQLEPPLLPIGGSLAIVRSGAPQEVRVHTPGAEPRTVPLGDTPDAGPADSVEIVLPAIAAGNELVIVDAPAAGGAGDARRRVIDAIVATADAAILVTRADAPVTAPEIDLLRAMRRHTGAALLVLTHADRHRGWRAILDESHASMRAVDARLLSAAPVAIAAPLVADAFAARRASSPDADELAVESGQAALFEAVRTCITARVKHVRLLSLVELATGVADELRETLATEATAVTDPADAMAAARATARRLRELSSTSLVRLADAFSGLRDTLAVDVGREVAAVMDEIDAALDETKDTSAVLDAADHLLEAARLRLDERTQRQVDVAVAEVVAQLDDGRDGDVADDAAGEVIDAEPTSTSRTSPQDRPLRKSVTASMRLRLVQAMLSGTGGVAMLAVMGGAAGGAADSMRFGAMGAGMLVGSISAAEGFREAKRQRSTQETKARVRSATEQWRGEYLASLRERLLREQRAQEAALRDALRRQIDEADAAVTALQQAARAGADEKRRRGLEATDARARLDDVQRRLGELADLLSG